MVPTQKISDVGSEFPKSLDHYKCYEVIATNTIPHVPSITLDDQFGSEQDVQVEKPRYFCVPVKKTLQDGSLYDIMNPDEHLVIYDIMPKSNEQKIRVKDQFEELNLRVIESVMLAVPSEKQAVVTHDD